MNLSTIILAAGKGKRMKSELPKVLHPLLGRPMIHYVIDTARNIGSEQIVLVIGHQKELVIDATRTMDVQYVVQEQQLGTGHAVLQTHRLFREFEGEILVLSGDVPLLRTDTLNKLIEVQRKEQPLASLLTTFMPNPAGYGRIVRDKQGFVSRIVEHKDASPEIRKINEINVGIYIFKCKPLFESLPLISNNNSQGEYYLPDIIKMYVERGEKVVGLPTLDIQETHGINDLEQLKHAENILSARS
ncbi:MAG: NTP transferase domain-containing protein [bacterium]|nr:MAG: NTP transferase domain-containing protein [bacterium]